MALFSPWMDRPWLSIPSPDLETPFSAVASLPVPDLVHTAELYPRDLDLEEVVPLRVSDRGWMSRPGDVPANTLFAGRLRRWSLEEAIPLTPEDGRRVTLQLSTLDIHNGDGAWDLYPGRYSIDGRRVVVRVGRWRAPFLAFEPVADLVGVSWQRGDAETISVALRDIGYRADVPINPGTYGGTGDDDGSADLAGKRKPVCFGPNKHVGLVLVDPALNIYQFHYRLADGVEAVYEGGSSRLAHGSTFASYAALKAAQEAGTILDGYYGVALTAGGSYIALGSDPTGTVTADVRGDAYGGYSDLSGEICRRILADLAGIPATMIDAAAWADLDAEAPYAVGWFQGTDAINAADALDAVLIGLGAGWGGGAASRFRPYRLTEPDPDAIAGSLDIQSIIAVQPLELPDSVVLPNWRRTMGYDRVWTVLDGNAVSGDVLGDDRSRLMTEYRTVASENSGVADSYELEREPPMTRGLFAEETDAQDENDRILALYDVPRKLFAVTVKAIGYRAVIGSTWLLTWPRYGLADGLLVRIAGRRVSVTEAGLEIVLTVWG